jgi:hypothetical protein
VWFAKLAKLVVPFAPYDSDAMFAAAALQIADALGEKAAPTTTFHTLDRIWLEVVRQTVAGLGGDPTQITLETTDMLIAPATRAVFTA